MVHITEKIVKKIEYHGERTYPEECCGILLGKSEEGNHYIVDCLEMDNHQDENRRRRFLITPDQYRFAERTAKNMNSELLGFYHSHPDHPAAPSAFDTDHALPWFTYLIVGVDQGKAAAMTAWKLNDGHTLFLEQTLLLEQTSALPSKLPFSSTLHLAL